MKLSWNTAVRIGLSVIFALLAGLALAQDRGPGPAGPAAGPGPGAVGRGFAIMDPVDSRVQLRTYLFTDTDETLPYAVFVPSNYSKDKKTPLVLALHGMNGSHRTFMRTACVDEAEKYGYILVGPMGYSSTGPFGMVFTMGGRGPGGPGATAGPGARAGAPGAAPAPANPSAPQAQPGPGAPQAGREGARGPGAGMGGMREPGGTKETDRAKVAELSEKDAMNVLAMVRKEFNVDDNRIYLMGHSMGGGGALHMGEKYATTWAAVAPLAPAAFGFTWSADQKLAKVPILIMVGDKDTLVTGAQQLADQLKGLKFQVEFKSMPGLDHGGIIAGAMPDVYKFFAAHTKPASK
jgi:dienelactone hydrolase